jgi:predicted enzyme related to lactoylglutathione lyase
MDAPKKSLSRREAIRRGTTLAAALAVPLTTGSAAAAEERAAPGPGAPVVHFEIGCRDEAKTREFFGKLFGWEISAPAAANVPAMISAAKEGISGHITSLGHEPQHYVTIYVQVDDIPTYLARVESLGGKKIIGPIEVPTGTFAWFNDLDGNIIALWKPKPA